MFLFYVEAPLVLLALILAFVYPWFGWSWLESVERRFLALANRQNLAVIVTGLLAAAVRLVLLPVLPIPQPAGLDEFGYLLLGDTFAHGRLTNPTNPMWMHFESIHILWQPTYTAKFYPAQGLFLAAGQVVFGHPFWGIVLSLTLMCAAITWMLQGWLPAGWALLGGILAVIRIGTFSYWANNYSGGAVAALGGALVLGALPRLRDRQRPIDAVLMGLGFALIANSRPYEGLFFGIPVAVTLLNSVFRKRGPELGFALKCVAAPLLIILVLTIAGMGFYFWRVTGSPIRVPYVLYEHTYNPVPYFSWQSLHPFPVYHHAVRRSYFQFFGLGRYELSRTVGGFVQIEAVTLLNLWSFFLGFALLLPLAAVLGTLPYGFSLRKISPGTRFLLIVCGSVILANMLPIWYFPHYSAPITCAILAIVLIAMRRIRQWHWHDRPAGLFITRAVPCACVLLLAARIAAAPFQWPPSNQGPAAGLITWCSRGPANPGRASILALLKKLPGRQLVIVKYAPNHNVQDEWVYNRADLASAKVIWARDMGPEENEELIKYFKKRRAWLVYADDNPPKLLPIETGPPVRLDASGLGN